MDNYKFLKDWFNINKKGIFTVLLFSLLPLNLFADSSWAWLTAIHPIYLAPFLMVLTIIIEYLCVTKIGKIMKKKRRKALVIVIIGNILSFVVPYCFSMGMELDLGHDWQYVNNYVPAYTVTLIFLIITLLIEMPFDFFFLFKDTKKRDLLIYSLLIGNTITTILNKVFELLLTPGKYF